MYYFFTTDTFKFETMFGLFKEFCKNRKWRAKRFLSDNVVLMKGNFVSVVQVVFSLRQGLMVLAVQSTVHCESDPTNAFVISS